MIVKVILIEESNFLQKFTRTSHKMNLHSLQRFKSFFDNGGRIQRKYYRDNIDSVNPSKVKLYTSLIFENWDSVDYSSFLTNFKEEVILDYRDMLYESRDTFGSPSGVVSIPERIKIYAQTLVLSETSKLPPSCYYNPYTYIGGTIHRNFRINMVDLPTFVRICHILEPMLSSYNGRFLEAVYYPNLTFTANVLRIMNGITVSRIRNNGENSKWKHRKPCKKL